MTQPANSYRHVTVSFTETLAFVWQPEPAIGDSSPTELGREALRVGSLAKEGFLFCLQLTTSICQQMSHA